MKEWEIRSLSEHQIIRLMKKGNEVERLKREWYRRYALEYPYYKSTSGIKKVGE